MSGICQVMVMAKSCRVALAQIKISENPDTNLKKILSCIRKASKAKADIIVFPETCIFLRSRQKVVGLKNHLHAIRSACKEYGIWCIVGSYQMKKGKRYNTTFLIDRSGKIVYTYDKVHLWTTEKGVSPGKRNRVVKTEFGKIGIICCWDFAFPEYIRKLSRAGAWIIFCPSYTIDYQKAPEVLEHIQLIRAFENSCYFVFADAFSQETYSRSCMAYPVKVIKEIRRREGLLVGYLDPSKMPVFTPVNR